MNQENGGSIRTGKAEADPTALTHVCGVRSGNNPRSYENTPGLLPDGHSNARRSTGINAEARNPILPGMPNLSPA